MAVLDGGIEVAALGSLAAAAAACYGAAGTQAAAAIAPPSRPAQPLVATAGHEAEHRQEEQHGAAERARTREDRHGRVRATAPGEQATGCPDQDGSKHDDRAPQASKRGVGHGSPLKTV